MSPMDTLNHTARIAKNTLVQLVAGLLNKFLAVALVIYAARQLGAQGFGQYSYVLSLLAIFYIVTDFGLGTVTTRDLAKDFQYENQYFSNVLAMRVLLSLGSALMMVATVALLGPSPQLLKLAAIAALSLFFTSNIDTCSAIFYAHQRMEMPATVSVIATTLRVTASLGALATGAGVSSLLWINTIASAAQFLLLLGVLGTYSPLRLKLDLKFWGKLWHQAWPLALANLFSVVYFRADTIMLAAFRGEKAVGLYNAAYRLLEFLLILPAYYNGAIFPVASASLRSNPQRFRMIYRRSLKYLWVAALPLAWGGAMLARPLVEVLYGGAYAACAPALRLLMWTMLLIVLNSINAPYLIILGRSAQVTWRLLFALLFNVGLNLYAIPRFGFLGAAWVMLLSEALTLSLFAVSLIKPLELTPGLLRHFIRPFLAAVVMAAVLRMVLRWDLGFQVLLGAAIYILLLIVFRVFDEVDWELFQRVARPMERELHGAERGMPE